MERDSEGFSREIGALLEDTGALEAMRRKAWDAGRAMIWPTEAAAYVAI